MSMKQNKSSAFVCTTKFFWPKWMSNILSYCSPFQSNSDAFDYSIKKQKHCDQMVVTSRVTTLLEYMIWWNKYVCYLSCIMQYIISCIMCSSSYSFLSGLNRIGNNVRSTYMYFCQKIVNFETFNNNFWKKII